MRNELDGKNDGHVSGDGRKGDFNRQIVVQRYRHEAVSAELRGELDVKEEGLREAGRALLDAVGESAGPSFVESPRSDVGSVTNTKGTGMLWMAMPGCLASQADFSYLPAAREAECVDTASKEYGDYQWEDTDGQEEHFPTLCDSV